MIKISMNNKKFLIEHFDLRGTGVRLGNTTKNKKRSQELDDYMKGSSVTSQLFCKYNLESNDKRDRDKKNITTRGLSQRKGIEIKPDKEQALSEFTEYNPFFYLLTLINFVIQLFGEFLGIFTWLFKECFNSMLDLMVPKSFSGKIGLHPGTKYCMNKIYWRYFLTMLCPPAGVFMAYGMSGYVQIIICCFLSLLYYIPGLIYAIVVMNRSDVAEQIENVAFGSCDGSSQAFFISNNDNKAQCGRTAGEKCHAGQGKPFPNDPSLTTCCIQPEYVNGEWLRDGEPARNAKGELINSYEEGELTCKIPKFNFLSNSDKGGICVFKSTGRPGV